VTDYPFVSIFAFVCLYALVTTISLPFSTLLTLTAGLLFGVWLGTLLAVVGATTGAVFLFLFIRSALGEKLRHRAIPHFNEIAEHMRAHETSYMLFMRLVPLFPFFAVNIAPALLGVRLRVYVLTTMIGMLPSTFIYAGLGQKFSSLTSLRDVMDASTFLALTGLGLLALIPVICRRKKCFSPSVAVTMLVALLGFTQPAMAQDDAYKQFLPVYDALLEAHVHPVKLTKTPYNGVNYDSWAADTNYYKARQLLLKSDPSTLQSDAARMAFWINAYNFLTIDLIISENENVSIKEIGGIFSSPWKSHHWEIAGRKYNLDQIEHAILRPMGDARIHFAINCASVSCPDLRTESYRADKLEEQLDAQVRLTLSNEAKGLRVEKDTLYVSRIFDWFADDFDDGNIQGWLRRYVGPEIPERMKYLPYNWSLNKSR